MTTEQKIKEAFDKALDMRVNMSEEERGSLSYYLFKAGYLALLNELKPIGVWNDKVFYRLPEGVTRD